VNLSEAACTIRPMRNFRYPQEEPEALRLPAYKRGLIAADRARL
jgi:hypothetical protein